MNYDLSFVGCFARLAVSSSQPCSGSGWLGRVDAGQAKGNLCAVSWAKPFFGVRDCFLNAGLRESLSL